MKALFHFTAPLLALITMIACTELEVSENPQNSNNELLQKLSITGKDFKFDGKTRSSVNIGESGASFTWDEDDVIGIFPDKGDQVSFTMDEGAGTQTATFSGGGWALKSSAKYTAYYPHVYENRDMTKIPVSYVGQTQNGNGNTDHIGAYDFMAAGVSTPENGAVAFDMQHLGALVQLTITVPKPSTLTKVVLTSSTEFTETGTIDLTADTPAIIADTQSTTLEISLNDVVTTEANENVIVYFMTAPIDLTDNELTAIVHLADDTASEMNIIGKKLQAGKAYKLSAEIEETILNNQIWYTSSDGNIITPTKTNFGANIVSNTYENGKGIITFDDDITVIGASAFTSCAGLTSIIIPETVTIIKQEAFHQCYSLKEIKLPNSVTSIESLAFATSGLRNITIPESVTSIGSNAFMGSSALSSIYIPASVTSIELGAFAGCRALTSITVDENNLTYDSRNNCNGIIQTSTNTLLLGCLNTVIPASVTKIGIAAFNGCSLLTNITIPENVTSIEPYSFMGCTSLSVVDIKATEPPALIENPFKNCSSNLTIYVPKESYNKYTTVSLWKDLNITTINQ